MADPQLPDIFKAQVVLKGSSGLPEDVFVNDWYFRNDEQGDPVTGTTRPDGAIKRVLDSFYFGIPGAGGGGTIAGHLSPVVVGAEYRIYDLGQAPPRERATLPAAFPGPVNAQGLPTEVAVCLSFFAGRNLPRSRGRIYIGPLNVAASTTQGDGRPTPQLIGSIADRASNVARTTENVTWVMVTKGGFPVQKEPAGAKVITAGWVDNAYDTQRRRGLAPQTRLAWSGT
jgi:hypothetical protein